MKKTKKIDVVFMGTSFFAAKILESLLVSGNNLLAVYSQPKKKFFRGKKSSHQEVSEIAARYKLKIFNPQKFDSENAEILRKMKPELLIVASYGKILPKEVLAIPKFGAINVHASLLPKYRGPSPIQNAILDGISETGTTIMLMDEKVDTGKILAQKKIKLTKKETYPEALEKIARLSADLLLPTLTLWVEKKIKPKKQKEREASYCQLIERSDGKINWSEDDKQIYNRFRALLPWPGIFTYFSRNGSDLRIKLKSIDLVKSRKEFLDKKIGEVFSWKNQICVRSGQGAILLKEIQLEGKPSVKIESFINGYRDFLGSILK